MFSDYTVSGTVTPDGRLQMTDEVRADFKKAIRHFRPGPVTLRVERDTGKRSSQANRYYRLVLGLISDHNGDDPADLHEFFKDRFAAPRNVTVCGKAIEIKSTADDSPEEFHEYVERVRLFALMELGVETPDPDPALRGQSRHAKRKAAA